jgi:hypothetical protein
MFQGMMQVSSKMYDELMQQRKQEVAEFVISAIRKA